MRGEGGREKEIERERDRGEKKLNTHFHKNLKQLYALLDVQCPVLITDGVEILEQDSHHYIQLVCSRVSHAWLFAEYWREGRERERERGGAQRMGGGG